MHRNPLLRHPLLDGGEVVHARQTGLGCHYGLALCGGEVVWGFALQSVCVVFSGSSGGRRFFRVLLVGMGVVFYRGARSCVELGGCGRELPEGAETRVRDELADIAFGPAAPGQFAGDRTEVLDSVDAVAT